MSSRCEAIFAEAICYKNLTYGTFANLTDYFVVKKKEMTPRNDMKVKN